MRPGALTRDERPAPTPPSPSAARWRRQVLLDPLCLIARSTRPLRWADLAAGRLRLDRLCRNGAGRLSSPGLRPFLAKQESLPAAILRCAPACGAGAASIARGLPIAIEAAIGAGSKQTSRRTTMATIGTFKKSGNKFRSEENTSDLQAKNVRIVPEANRSG